MRMRHHRFDRITFDPAQCFGKACIRGMRMPVSSILGYLGSGMTLDQILGEWPELEAEDIYQALAYAAGVVEERVLPLEEPVLPKAPTHYDPRRRPDAARERRDLVLARMAEQGRIGPAQAAAAQRREQEAEGLAQQKAEEREKEKEEERPLPRPDWSLQSSRSTRTSVSP